MSPTATIPRLETLPMAPPATSPLDPPTELVDLLLAGNKLIRIGTSDDAKLYVSVGRELSEHIYADPRFSANISRPGFHTAGQVGGMVDVFANSIVRLDDPDHARVRNLVTSEFRPRKLQDLMPDIDVIVTDCLENLKAAGSGSDVVEIYTTELVSRVASRFLGIREEHRAYLKELTNHVNDPDVGLLPEAENPLNRLAVELSRLHDLDAFDDGMLKNLHQHEINGEISRAELISMGVLLVFAGHETTANSIALGIALVLSDPALMAELRANPEQFEQLSDEVLRLTAVTRSGPRRFVVEDAELDGFQFKAGDTIYLANQVANRDPDYFTNPHEVYLHRPRTEKVVTFGAGMHMCLGQFIARAEMRVAFKGLLLGFNDLALPVAVADLNYKGATSIYTVSELPVTWSSTNF